MKNLTINATEMERFFTIPILNKDDAAESKYAYLIVLNDVTGLCFPYHLYFGKHPMEEIHAESETILQLLNKAIPSVYQQTVDFSYLAANVQGRDTVELFDVVPLFDEKMEEPSDAMTIFTAKFPAKKVFATLRR